MGRSQPSVMSPKYGYYISERNGAGFGGATTSQCSFIARRSDSKDGVVPPEPVGPMEVAGCHGLPDRAHTHFYRSVQRPRSVWQHPSEIVIVFRRQDTDTSLNEIRIVQNWSEELKERVPVP